MAEDLTLEETAGLYSLGPLTDDQLVRMRDRWTVQFLSCLDDPRGSILITELEAGRVRTNADVLGLYGLTAAQIINNMRQLAEDIVPIRAELLEFEFIDFATLRIRDRLVAREGAIEAETIVTTEEATT